MSVTTRVVDWLKWLAKAYKSLLTNLPHLARGSRLLMRIYPVPKHALWDCANVLQPCCISKMESDIVWRASALAVVYWASDSGRGTAQVSAHLRSNGTAELPCAHSGNGVTHDCIVSKGAPGTSGEGRRATLSPTLHGTSLDGRNSLISALERPVRVNEGDGTPSVHPCRCTAYGRKATCQ